MMPAPDWETGPPRALPLDSDERAPLPDELRPLAEAVCELAAVSRDGLLDRHFAQMGYAWLADNRRVAVVVLHQPDWRERLSDALTGHGRPVRVGLAGGIRLLDPRAADSHPEVAVTAYPSIPALRVLVLNANGLRGALAAHAPTTGVGDWEEIAVPVDDDLAALIQKAMGH